ncbi:serine/threonine-protein kinase [Myxococcus sp. RHSTA-1-4]|uniref:serine/threonine protein kinase n=1 Tax=Myxococcus sp. RHSTA-1-4 TaxID=2874601 RepID=UPI001CC0E065|nr:serine/threonine-protein kinase [Myxococcus sp. RHSTA-1-4]MBZ4420518.1 protein kinase [Myxococcus sp. RHSTA-1-4]
MHSDIPKVNPDALPPGTVVGGCWRLLERLGVGGYGAVYRVEAIHHPGPSFALKMSRQPYEPRSRRELTLLMDQAVHPHVVAVHACGRWPDVVSGHFFFVMDWVPGPALHLWADLHNPSFQQLADAARRVALILDALHAAGVLHRDLKPEHILMRGPHGDPVIIDLGSGDYLGAPTLTTGPLPPGTRHLRSPEAVRFHQRHWRRPDAHYVAAPTDDLYALGVCLYRAATGHYPFSPDWPADVLYAAIASQQPPAPSAVNPRVPASLGAVILRLLEKAPERRFETGAQLHEALVQALKEHPRESWEAPLFDWHEAPAASGDAAVTSAHGHRTRRPEWPTHTHRPPSMARAKLLRLWAELLGALRPPPRPGPHASPGKAVLEGKARRVYPHRRRALLAAAGLAMVAGLVALGARASGTWRNTTAQVRHEATTSAGQKMARLAEAPHTAPVAVPPPAEPTPAAAAPVVASSQEAAPVKKKTAPVPRPQAPQTPEKKPTAHLLKTAAAAVACTGLACASTPALVEQPLPPAEKCPPGAAAVMEKLEVPLGIIVSGDFAEETAGGNVTVREGRAKVDFLTSVGKMPGNAWLSGHIYISKTRVHGRFTSLHIKDAQYPACFEIFDFNERRRGAPRKPGGDNQNAIINSQIGLTYVRDFERFE